MFVFLLNETHSDSSTATGHLYCAVLNRQMSAYCRTADTQTRVKPSNMAAAAGATGNGCEGNLRSSSSSPSCWCCWWRERWRWWARRGNKSETEQNNFHQEPRLDRKPTVSAPFWTDRIFGDSMCLQQIKKVYLKQCFQSLKNKIKPI